MSDQLSWESLLAPTSENKKEPKAPAKRKTSLKPSTDAVIEARINALIEQKARAESTLQNVKAQVAVQLPVKTEVIIETETTESQTAAEPEVFTVSDLNRQIKGLLEKSFPFLWVKGEISNFKVPGSGHLYFTLKDEGSQVRA